MVFYSVILWLTKRCFTNCFHNRLFGIALFQVWAIRLGLTNHLKPEHTIQSATSTGIPFFIAYRPMALFRVGRYCICVVMKPRGEFHTRALSPPGSIDPHKNGHPPTRYLNHEKYQTEASSCDRLLRTRVVLYQGTKPHLARQKHSSRRPKCAIFPGEPGPSVSTTSMSQPSV